MSIPKNWLPAVFDETTRKPLAARNGHERESVSASVTIAGAVHAMLVIGTESQWEAADEHHVAVERDPESGKLYIKPAVLSSAIDDANPLFAALNAVAVDSLRPAAKD